jgi:hypothetical protein
MVCSKDSDNQWGYEAVRYWSFGKSGLTARGIQEEMVPLLHLTADRIEQSRDDKQQELAIHAIVLLCGVNNVLTPQCTPKSFSEEVSSLLLSIRNHPGLKCTPILILGLPDFSKLPFLPSWPMGWLLGLKGRKMQSVLEEVMEHTQHEDGLKYNKVVMVQIPEVQDIIGSRGYRRLESSSIQDKTKSSSSRFISSFCHPLQKHLGQINPCILSSLGINDFLCDDGFHPGRYGTVYIGSLIADAYEQLVGPK